MNVDMCESTNGRLSFVATGIWKGTDSKYAQMWRELLALTKAFPVLPAVTEGEGAVSLSAEEHKAFVRYLDLKHEMENIER